MLNERLATKVREHTGSQAFNILSASVRVLITPGGNASISRMAETYEMKSLDSLPIEGAISTTMSCESLSDGMFNVFVASA